MSRPALSLDELRIYYRGVHFATVALKGRLARLGAEQRPCVEEVNRYQAMIGHYREAIDQTRELQAAAR